MNAKQERFCLAYAECGSATQAAIESGYSPRTARKQGSRLLTNVDIMQRIRELSRELHSGKIASVASVQAFWTEVLKDAGAKMPDRLKASELLARSQGAFLEPVPYEEELSSDEIIIYLPKMGAGDE